MFNRLIFLSTLPVLMALGCASAPRWTKGVPEGLSSYYFQGVGYARSRKAADQNAKIALAAEREGAEVKAITEDNIRYVQTEKGERYTQVLTDKGSVIIRGKIPPATRVVERWYNRSAGEYWSYALLIKPGMKQRIKQEMDQRLRLLGLKSLFPGWAQFTKRQNAKGWRILALEGLSLAGTGLFTLLTADAVDRRDKSTAQSDIDYYDTLANRFYWASVVSGVVAGGTYLYSLVDGLASEPKPYQVLSRRIGDHPLRLGFSPKGVTLSVSLF